MSGGVAGFTPGALERAALVALLRVGRRPWREYREEVQQAGSAVRALERELRGTAGQGLLLPEDPTFLLEDAAAEIARWESTGMALLTVLEPGYPHNLLLVHDHPPLLFLAGALEPRDDRSVAVIGSRRASTAGRRAATEIARHLVDDGWTVVSGLAAGIDTAAHRTALDAGGRTVAVIGTGLAHAYPAQNAGLQREIASTCAVVSQFWPDAPPTRQSFPRRNAVMSGMARASVVVEASARSGARVQARLALAHGRPVFIAERLLSDPWARELAGLPGVHVVSRAPEITATLERLEAGELTE